jgi:CO/xanthine dehydrogenase Mo-binding subunit
VSILGRSISRIDAYRKVTGEALFPGDIYLPDMLHMKVLFAGRPHARIRAIDTTKAEAFPGVVAVFSAKDVPVNIYGLIRPDQPVLCGPGSDQPDADTVRFVGDRIALVVADSEEAAIAGRELIEVQFENLPVVTDPRVSINAPEGAPLLFQDSSTNIVAKQPIRKGDIGDGFSQAEVIVEEEYQTSFQEHAYLQPEAGVAYVDEEGVVTVKVAGQWAHADRSQIARALNISEGKVRVIYAEIGGAFGGREDLSVQILLALAAWRLDQRGIHKPVKIIWSREESIIAHHKRHPMYIKAKWGANRNGKVVAAQMEIISDAGAYQSTSSDVLGITALMCTGPYEIPNIWVDAFAVYTNNITCGAFRGFGAPQAALAAEGQMTKLAEKLGMDPVDFRMRNVLTDEGISASGTPLAPGVSMGTVLAECAKSAGWKLEDGVWKRPDLGFPRDAVSPIKNKHRSMARPNPALRRGISIACGYKNVGFNCGYQENCTVKIELHGGPNVDKAVVYLAGAEVGQGAHTVIVQLTAEVLGLPVEKIELVASDTATTEDSGSSSASRMTFMAGNAIQGAGDIVLAKWNNEDRPAVATYTYLAPPTTPFDPETGFSTPNITYAYVAEAVEVEVDIETGQVNVLKVVCVDDAGKVINPKMAEGQVQGAVVQGHGYALYENFIVEDGYIKTPNLSTYLIPTVLDVPEQLEIVFLEIPDPYGPYGVRGIGEVSFIPMAAAICGAVKDATGVWINQIPMTPPRVLQKLGETGEAERIPGLDRAYSR